MFEVLAVARFFAVQISYSILSLVPTLFQNLKSIFIVNLLILRS